jgi:hypothetical protein
MFTKLSLGFVLLAALAAGTFGLSSSTTSTAGKSGCCSKDATCSAKGDCCEGCPDCACEKECCADCTDGCKCQCDAVSLGNLGEVDIQ